MPLYLFILLTAIGILLTFCYGDASSQKVMGESTPPATLEDWLVIGPFQIGTRGMLSSSSPRDEPYINKT